MGIGTMRPGGRGLELRILPSVDEANENPSTEHLSPAVTRPGAAFTPSVKASPARPQAIYHCLR